MAGLVAYERTGAVARIVMDDGKVNAMSPAMLSALDAAFERAEGEKAVVLLTGRENIFSAGFDLKVFAGGNPDEIYEMMKRGAELALRVLSFPLPVVAACNGNAFPMGAFLLLGSDMRFGAEGAFRIGLNEVAIGITLPLFAVELARARLTPPYFHRVVTGEMLAPQEAVTAGFLDRLVAPDDLPEAAGAAAEALAKIDLAAHKATKERMRADAVKAIRTAIDAEITLENYRRRALLSD